MNKAIAVADDLAKRYADRAMNGAGNLIGEEKSRAVYLACVTLEKLARDAEHTALMAMTSVMQNQAQDAVDFFEFTRNSLKLIHDQLRFISGVINGGDNKKSESVGAENAVKK